MFGKRCFAKQDRFYLNGRSCSEKGIFSNKWALYQPLH